MKVRCLYRWTSDSEIIHSTYDTEERTIEGIPPQLFTANLDPTDWNPLNYERLNEISLGFAEAYMCEHPNCSVCIEVDNIAVFTLLERYWYLLWADDWNSADEPASEEETIPKFYNKLKPVGYRPTKVIQVSQKPKIARLIVNASSNKAYTQDGMIPLNFSLQGLGEPSKTFKGYVDCVEKGYYAVVYDKDGNPKYLKLDNGTLKFV